LRIPLESGERFLDTESGDPEERLMLLLNASQRRRLPAPAADVEPEPGSDGKTTDPSIRGRIRAARLEIEGQSKSVPAWESASEQDVRRWQRHVFRGVLAKDERAGFEKSESPSVSSYHAKNLTKVLRDSIERSVEGEHDSIFWLIGFWKWFEIAIWTCFGVLAKAIYEYGTHAIGKHAKNEVFEPRETWRILSRLLYAPLLALVFFWVAVGTRLIDAPTFFVNYTLASLSIAFLIGIFPNTIYRLLTNVFNQLLKGGERPEPPTDRAGALVKVSGPKPSAPTGALPSFTALSNRISDLVVAPLEAPGTHL